MSEYYHIVPWYNSAEWHNVYNAIYSENINKQHALTQLLVWKARCPFLPSGIESTLSLLQVHIQDLNSNDDVEDDQILRLAYSSAVMRFVNHMLDTETSRGASLYQAARNLGVPDWVIDLRHDTAHSNNLPSLTLLRNACEISLEWLHKNYWDKHKECIQDYSSGLCLVDTENNDENRINSLIYFYSCLSICKHCNIKKILDIPDVNMQESIVSDATALLEDLSNIKTMLISSLLNIMHIQAKKFLNAKDTVLFVNKSLLGEESLILSLDLVEFLSEAEFKQNKLSRRYVHCFEVLLTFLHTNNFLMEFVLALMEMTQTCDCSQKALLGALWVSEILSSIKKSKQFLSRSQKMDSYRKKKDLKQLYFHWFPNERTKGLVLDLQKPVPTKLTDINFLQPIIASYNPYLTYFVSDLLVLVEPKIPKEVFNKICKLAQLISTPDKFPVQFSPHKIYTVADVKMVDHMDENNCGVSILNDCNELSNDIGAEFISGIWKIASKQSWSTCPIGKVPQPPEKDIEMI